MTISRLESAMANLILNTSERRMPPLPTLFARSAAVSQVAAATLSAAPTPSAHAGSSSAAPLASSLPFALASATLPLGASASSTHAGASSAVPLALALSSAASHEVSMSAPSPLQVRPRQAPVDRDREVGIAARDLELLLKRVKTIHSQADANNIYTRLSTIFNASLFSYQPQLKLRFQKIENAFFTHLKDYAIASAPYKRHFEKKHFSHAVIGFSV